MKLLTVLNTEARSGGNIYEKLVHSVLKKNYDLENYSTIPAWKGQWKYFYVPFYFIKLFQISRMTGYQLSVRSLETSWLLNKKPMLNIIMLYHIDSSYSSFISGIYQNLLAKRLLLLNRSTWIVVISKYWQKHLTDLGFRNTKLVFNGYDLEEFNFSDQEIMEFKQQHQLTDKPIIYIGNAQVKKGAGKAYEALKSLDAYLVTSGRPLIDIPALNLELNYRNYLKLLKASSVVVTMSLFKEGWCRTAHEAMLCKTPVVGSGLGGMHELLEGGQQLICNDFTELSRKVSYAMENSKELGEKGYAYGCEFTMERFEQVWVDIVEGAKSKTLMNKQS
jgi:glycosyltransferase involved in cell wall biosynthesis